MFVFLGRCPGAGSELRGGGSRIPASLVALHIGADGGGRRAGTGAGAGGLGRGGSKGGGGTGAGAAQGLGALLRPIRGQRVRSLLLPGVIIIVIVVIVCRCRLPVRDAVAMLSVSVSLPPFAMSRGGRAFVSRRRRAPLSLAAVSVSCIVEISLAPVSLSSLTVPLPLSLAVSMVTRAPAVVFLRAPRAAPAAAPAPIDAISFPPVGGVSASGGALLVRRCGRGV